MTAAVNPSDPIPMLKDLPLMQPAQLQVRRRPKIRKHAKLLGEPSAHLVRPRLTTARWKLERRRNDGPNAKKESKPVKHVSNRPVKRKRPGVLQRNKLAARHAKNAAPKKSKPRAKPKQRLRPRPPNDASAAASVKKNWLPKPNAAARASKSLFQKSIPTKPTTAAVAHVQQTTKIAAGAPKLPRLNAHAHL